MHAENNIRNKLLDNMDVILIATALFVIIAVFNNFFISCIYFLSCLSIKLAVSFLSTTTKIKFHYYISIIIRKIVNATLVMCFIILVFFLISKSNDPIFANYKAMLYALQSLIILLLLSVNIITIILFSTRRAYLGNMHGYHLDNQTRLSNKDMFLMVAIEILIITLLNVFILFFAIDVYYFTIGVKSTPPKIELFTMYFSFNLYIHILTIVNNSLPQE